MRRDQITWPVIVTITGVFAFTLCGRIAGSIAASLLRGFRLDVPLFRDMPNEAALLTGGTMIGAGLGIVLGIAWGVSIYLLRDDDEQTATYRLWTIAVPVFILIDLLGIYGMFEGAL